MRIRGVGAITALSFVLTIEELSRFTKHFRLIRLHVLEPYVTDGYPAQ